MTPLVVARLLFCQNAHADQRIDVGMVFRDLQQLAVRIEIRPAVSHIGKERFVREVFFWSKP